ncbi:MAG: hypothetical protein MUD08_15425 [Cytophagales bacterium]|nr:hypothetical protein [Cytophagales bacterium]
MLQKYANCPNPDGGGHGILQDWRMGNVQNNGCIGLWLAFWAKIAQNASVLIRRAKNANRMLKTAAGSLFFRIGFYRLSLPPFQGDW